MMRIDSHHHLWDQTVRPQSWMDAATDTVIGGPHSLADWDAAASQHGITHGIFVQTVPDATETPDVLALAAGHPQLAAVVGWIDIENDPRPPGDQLDALLACPGGERLTGVRVAAEYSPDPNWLASPSVTGLATALAERGMTLDILLSPANLRAASELARARPDTTMVLNHLAKPSMRSADFAAWSAGVSAFASLDNVACKFSGVLTFDDLPMTHERLSPYSEVTLETFGPGRIMFGSDWPVSVLGGGYSAAVEITEQFVAPLSADETARVWSETARNWYPALDRALRTSRQDHSRSSATDTSEGQSVHA